MDSTAAAFQAGLSQQATQTTAASILSGTTQALGALQADQAGRAQAQSLRGQAGLEEARAEREQLRGRQQVNSIREELVRNISSQQAAAGASGMTQQSDVFGGALRQSIEAGEREIRVARGNANTRARARSLQASRLRTEARFARISGRAQRNQGLLSAFSGVATRGFISGGESSGGGSGGVAGNIPNSALQSGTGGS